MLVAAVISVSNSAISSGLKGASKSGGGASKPGGELKGLGRKGFTYFSCIVEFRGNSGGDFDDALSTGVAPREVITPLGVCEAERDILTGEP